MFLLPLDVANQQGYTGTAPGGLPMAQMTLGLYSSSIIIVLIIMPFTVFYYEGEDADDNEDGGGKRLVYTLFFNVRFKKLHFPNPS